MAIEAAPFSEDVEKLIIPGTTASTTLDQFRTLLTKYRILEDSLETRRVRIGAKLDEIDNSIQVIRQIRPATAVRFGLGDTLFAKAVVEDKISLWLGANVMLQYPADEAIALLNQKQADHVAMRTKIEGDLDFVRRQITTVQVDMARVYNWAVKNNRD